MLSVIRGSSTAIWLIITFTSDLAVFRFDVGGALASLGREVQQVDIS